MDDREALVHLTAAIFAGNEGISVDSAVKFATQAYQKIHKVSFDGQGEVLPRSPRSYSSRFSSV